MRRRVWFWLATVIALAFFLFPIIWVFLNAIKAKTDILNIGVEKLFIFTPSLENFQYVFYSTGFWGEIRNTAIMAVASTALVMVVSLPAAYSFARFNTGSGHLLFVTISTRMFPIAVAAIPFFFAFKELGLIDTHIGLILLLLYFNMSFATFLLFGFFREIPEELEQAAMVDGYGRIEILRKVIFPLIKPGAAITTVFCLVWAWNEFLFAFLFTRLNARTASVGLSAFWGSFEAMWGPMAAMMALTILPTLLAAWFMQRYIIRGLTFGAVKG